MKSRTIISAGALLLMYLSIANAQRAGGPGGRGGAPTPLDPPFQPTNVPHGTVAAVWYPSPVTNGERRMMIYTPPGYETSDATYPVLYLFHGGGGNEDNWFESGMAHVALDNLIASGAIAPMIVVTPNANWDNAAAPAHAPALAADTAGAAGAPPMGLDMEKAENDIVNGQIRYIETHYRAQPGRENRAIAGLSMGGGIAISVGLKRLDQFAWIGEFSTGLFGGVNGAAYEPFDPDALWPGFLSDPAATNTMLELLYLSCGTEDPRIEFTADAAEMLADGGIDVTFASFPGGHEWSVWRDSLVDFGSKLFR